MSFAAEFLNVHQQSISSKLKRLRATSHNWLFVREGLFVKEGHGIVPTPCALSIQFEVEAIIQPFHAFSLSRHDDRVSSERTRIFSATDDGQDIIIKMY